MPPSRSASRRPGGKLGAGRSWMRSTTTGRMCLIWPEKNCAAPSRRQGASCLRHGRRLTASIRLASSALGASISSSSDPSTFDARCASTRGASTWISSSVTVPTT